MVERSCRLDTIFQALADQTRRDILRRVSNVDVSISTLAKPYKMSFAAIAKHVAVLESAKLVTKRRDGKQQIVSLVPKTMTTAQAHLEQYQKLWESRFETLDELLRNDI